MTPAISAIVPIHNEARVLSRVLDAIDAQTVSPEELILVFDRCTDASEKVAGGRYSKSIRVNLGSAAGAVRMGIDLAAHEWIVLFDGNTWVPVDFIQKLAQTQATQSADVIEWHGGLMLIPRSTFDKFGPFSDMPLWTLEYFLRVKDQGGRVVKMNGPFTRLRPSPLSANFRYGLDYAELSSRHDLYPFFQVGTKSGWVQDIVATLGVALGHLRRRKLVSAIGQTLRMIVES